MTKEQFIADIRAGIPETLPEPQIYDTSINHAPKRKDILTAEERSLHFAMHCAISQRNSTQLWHQNLLTS